MWISDCASRLRVLLFVVLLLGAYAPLSSAQAPFLDDRHWDARFGPPALFSNPYNVEATRDYVIVTGQHHDGKGSWRLGTVYRAADGDEVHELDIAGWEEATIIAGDARIYARRGWDDVEVAELDLDSSTAHPIVDPPGSYPQLTTYRDTLFALAEGAVYRWNGTEWDSLGPPLDLGTYERYSINGWDIGPSGVFVAVGPGSICDPDSCITDVWHLGGSAWTMIGAVKGGSGNANPPVSALTTDSQGRLIIAGSFTSMEGAPANRVARWDGVAWHALGEIPGADVGFITDLAAADTALYAAGGVVLKWNGATWERAGARPNDFLRDLETAGERLYASGWFTTIGDAATYRVAEWRRQEEHWTPVFPAQGAGIDGQVRALATGTGGSLFAGGIFAAAGGAPARNVARWDSTRWHSVGEGIAEPVQTLAADASHLYAGTYEGIAQTNLRDTSWSYLPGLPDGRRLSYVDDLLLTGGVLYTSARAGEYPDHTRGVFRYVDGAWQTLGEFHAGSGTAEVHALAAGTGEEIYAAGRFTRVGDVQARNVARWDGAAWHPLGAGPEAAAVAVEAGHGHVYVGASWTDSLFVWSDASESWTGVLLPEGEYDIERTVNALLWRPDGLYVGGRTEYVATKREGAGDYGFTLARWDGKTWHVPGSGITGSEVSALAGSGDDLYVAGSFTEAGDKASYHVARWNASVRLEATRPEEPRSAGLEQNYPNPFATSTTIRFVLKQPAARARLEVIDLLGRPVVRLLDTPLAAGAHEVAFDGSNLAGGVYICRLTAGDQTWSHVMLLAR